MFHIANHFCAPKVPIIKNLETEGKFCTQKRAVLALDITLTVAAIAIAILGAPIVGLLPTGLHHAAWLFASTQTLLMMVNYCCCKKSESRSVDGRTNDDGVLSDITPLASSGSAGGSFGGEDS